MMSASHHLSVVVRGQGGHGSSPHRAKDPIAATAEMITSLQTMVTRRFDIFDPVVITVGIIEGGTRRNIIPDTARFEATVRRFSEASAVRLREGIQDTLRGVAQAHGVEVEIDYGDEYPLTVNTAAEVDFSASVVREVLGEERYEEMDVPDRRVRGLLAGCSTPSPARSSPSAPCCPGLDHETAATNHSPRADFDPAVLPDAGGGLRRARRCASCERRLAGSALSSPTLAAAADRGAAQHDRGGAVGVVARAAVDLDEALAGVERQRSAVVLAHLEQQPVGRRTTGRVDDRGRAARPPTP